MNQVFRIATFLVLFAITVGSVRSSMGQATDESKPTQQDAKPEKRPLKNELEAFAPFIGTWVFDGQWKNGGKLWTKNIYSIGMNGNFVDAKTLTKNEHGKKYQRYHTIWRFNPEKQKVESYGFSFDGSVTVTNSDIDMSDPKHPIVRSQWKQKSEQIIKQAVRLIDENSYSWKVWSSDDGQKWEQIMDGVWKKQK